MQSLEWSGKVSKWKDEFRLRFQLHVPPAEMRKPEDKKLPLLVHLHGVAGIGSDNLAQINDGNQASQIFIDKPFQSQQACYIMLPQTERMSGWYALSFTDPSRELQAIVHAIGLMAQSPDYQIDLDRIYVTGLSMGAAGAFQAMAKIPNFFAAAAPTSYVDTEKIYSDHNCGPLWVAISSRDEHLKPRLENFVKHYKAIGGDIQFRVVNSPYHDIWSPTYKSAEFREWLFKQKL